MSFRCKNCGFGVNLDRTPILWVCPKCGEYHYPENYRKEERIKVGT